MDKTLPKISVITPSYNQGQFIEQTILSVISQHYQNIEYIIMDGGSSDKTVDIIKKYEKYVSYWQSEKDNGQSAAINEGFKRATGDILCWLNSDDMYMPGIFEKIASNFAETAQPKIVFGNCLHFKEGQKKTRGSNVVRASETYNLSLCDYVIQPSSFWNRSAWNTNGILDENLIYSFDWEWFIRAKNKGVNFVPMQEYLSIYRIHDTHKSGTGSMKRFEELKAVVAKYNDERLSGAFNKWISMYSKNNFLSKTIDAAQRFDISIANTFIRWLFFPRLSKKEYLNIVGMN